MSQIKPTEVLKQSEEIFRLMVESVQDYAIFLLDPTGHILTWNLGAKRFKGYEPHEIIGQHFSRFYPPEDISQCKPQKELEEAIQKGRVEDIGWRLRKDGKSFWAHVTITALYGPDGVLRGFSKVTRDMTEQKKAEENLRQSEERLRLMVESVQDYSIYMLDENGMVASWNVGAERAKGYKAAEIIGKHFSRFYTPLDIQNNKPQRNLEIALREGHCLDEGWRLRKDGTEFWASVVITPVKNKDGSLRGFAKVTRDMTDKKRAEDELERKVIERTKALEQSNKELQQFAYVASHDLQEPLRMVAMYIDLLNSRIESKLTPDESDYLKFATDGAERAQRLIRDLLEYSQVSSKGETFKTVDLNITLKQVLENLKITLDENHAEIEYSPMPILSVDESQIFQLMQNLISNAIKYRGQKPVKIKISAQESQSSWIFSIEDNGIGIEPEFHKKIFELFQRLHGKDKYPGTGLGLAICKKIIDHHQGLIWVESELDKGATFKFSLPKNRNGRENQ